MENDTNMSIEQGRTEEARQLLLQALEARRSVFGAEHPSTFMTMHNLGWIYNRQGRVEETEKLYLQALELTKIVLGVEHPQTVATHNLALIYRNQRRMKEDEKLWPQVLESRFGARTMQDLVNTEFNKCSS